MPFIIDGTLMYLLNGTTDRPGTLNGTLGSPGGGLHMRTGLGLLADGSGGVAEADSASGR